ncbi:patatin-like phospholipase family protein [Acinetobacter seifertii]|uniref:patatin-like phospholipase family protein n=1 Tax=Acinetobacter seifertii TaxID=1530123 RepID=UPI001F057801|nr:patatin-like phospholipase family protein [Acinetobacter seifertii]MCH2003085.1 patatin-like phospholipase family protein [Acinetobacter seifertii]
MIINHQFMSQHRKTRSHKEITLILLLAVGMLNGCASYRLNDYKTYNDTSIPWQQIDERETKYYQVEKGHIAGKPELGLALSGGGQRAAAVSIGFLEALQEKDILSHVDTISSVSGGSYAAYWWYTHHYWAAKEKELPKLKKDLFKRYYISELCDSVSNNLNTNKSIEPDSYKEKCAQEFEHMNLQKRYENYRFFTLDRNSGHLLTRIQEPLEAKFPSANGLGGLDEGLRITENFGKTTSLTVTWPLHILVNGLFDMKLNVNMFQKYYQNGLEREYGRYPICNENTCKALKSYANQSGNPLSVEITDPSTDELYAEITQQKLPFWVINTTATYSQKSWPKMLRNLPIAGYSHSLANTVYEFTPVSQGSPRFGYCSQEQEGCHLSKPLKLSRKIAISGAAIDALSPTQNTLIDVANLSLGQYVSNPKIADNVRTVHRMLPIPFVWFHENRHDEQSPFIYLTDGGHSDNLGIYSLIRRGTKKIIVLDSEHEGGQKNGETTANFEALRKDRCMLMQDHGVFISIPELNLPSIEDDCSLAIPHFKNLMPGMTFDFHHANQSVFIGTIYQMNSNFKDIENHLSDTVTAQEIAKIYYVKLSADYSDTSKPQAVVNDLSKIDNQGDCLMGKFDNSGKYSCDTRSYAHERAKGRTNSYPQVSTADIAFGPEEHSAYVGIGYDLGRMLDYDASTDEIKVK